MSWVLVPVILLGARACCHSGLPRPMRRSASRRGCTTRRGLARGRRRFAVGARLREPAARGGTRLRAGPCRLRCCPGRCAPAAWPSVCLRCCRWRFETPSADRRCRRDHGARCGRRAPPIVVRTARHALLYRHRRIVRHRRRVGREHRRALPAQRGVRPIDALIVGQAHRPRPRRRHGVARGDAGRDDSGSAATAVADFRRARPAVRGRILDWDRMRTSHSSTPAHGVSGASGESRHDSARP